MNIDHDGLTVAQAAAALGISENALRCRLRDDQTDTTEYLAVRSIERGRTRWRIILRTSGAPGAATGSGPGVDQVPPPLLQAAAAEWVAPLVARLEARAEEIGMLRGQLAAAEAEAERLRADLAALRSAASTPPPAAPVAPSGWRSVWRRRSGG
jgi:hypothetical protein